MPLEQEVIGQCRLYRADCRDVLPALTGQVKRVVTDPPYGVGLTAKRAYLGHGKSITTIRHGQYAHPDTVEYLREVVIPTIRQCCMLAQSVIVTTGARHMWEYPQPDDIGCFFSPAGTGMGKWGFVCMHPILYYGKDPYLEKSLGSYPNSHGQIYPNDANKQAHVCAKPLPMMRWLVNRGSLSTETVLDPFMGAGTTGCACVELGREFIGIDLDTFSFDESCRRIEAAYRQLSLFPPSAPLPHPQQLALVPAKEAPHA